MADQNWPDTVEPDYRLPVLVNRKVPSWELPCAKPTDWQKERRKVVARARKRRSIVPPLRQTRTMLGILDREQYLYRCALAGLRRYADFPLECRHHLGAAR